MKKNTNTLKERQSIIKGIKFNIRNKKVNISYRVILHSILILYTLVCLFPFIFAVFSSFKPSNELMAQGQHLHLFPKEWTLENYKALFDPSSMDQFPIWNWMLNSVLYAVITATINIFLNFLLGYALAKISFRGRNVVMWYVITSLLVPVQLIQFPQFFILQKMGFIQPESYIYWMVGIIFGSALNLYNTLMARQYFSSMKGTEEEAAVIDGVSYTAVFFKVTLRKSIPLIATQWSLVFLWSWNNFIMFQLFAMGFPDLFNLVSGINAMASSNFDRLRDGKMFAGAIISFIPTFLIYIGSLIYQRRVAISGEK